MNGSQPVRCGWATGASPRERAYHDEEWGVVSRDEHTLYEFLVLEGAQAGLSWRTILDKREGYARAFARFDPTKVSRYREEKIAKLLEDPRIVRNRLKVNAAVTNARAFLETQVEFGSFANYIWDFVDGRPIQNAWKRASQVPASTPLSDKVSKDLTRRGFKFVGSTIMYSYMQAVGMINDHLVSCFRYETVRAQGEST
ncbi:MAG: DNA-3-methyladenine glycosylase I [Gammaproteobacteria bacterium]|nr:DNA-3-methyladenine glycosylase I [Gammaproteobacteria bacterium]|tara:strand:+ start:143 stop:739 length:597 start_codon:yes stop_codon:yes gene_type:complete